MDLQAERPARQGARNHYSVHPVTACIPSRAPVCAPADEDGARPSMKRSSASRIFRTASVRPSVMRKLLGSLALAPILAASSAIADYEACMKFCVAEHGFSHCNAVCTGGGSKASEGNKAKDEENKDNTVETIEVEACDTLEDKGEAIYWLIRERIGYPLMSYGPTDKANVINVEFYPPSGQECEGIATFSANCDLMLEYQCESLDKIQ